jgi:hypothetical protein
MANSKNAFPRVGQMPSADFLPPKIRELHQARWNRHKLSIATLVVIVVSAIGLLVAQNRYDINQANLVARQNETQRILNLESRYTDIIALGNQSSRLTSALAVAHDKDIAWNGLLHLIQKSIPDNGRIAAFSLTGTGAMESTVGSDAISHAPVAVVANITLQSPTFQGIEFFLLDARQWPGYQSGSIVSLQKKDSGYLGIMSINLGKGVLSSETGSAIPLVTGGVK